MTTFNELTKQEQRVMELVVRGWRNAKIANELYISTRTVETHLYHIFDKLGVTCRTEAALVMLRTKAVSGAEIRKIAHDTINQNAYARDIG